MAGLAPGVTLMAVKVLDETGYGTSESIALGTDYAVSHGARVLNFSLGGSSQDSIEATAIEAALAAGCVVVAASGNESDLPNSLAPLDYPAAYPGVISVGATDENDNVAFYSNGGEGLDLVAPGGAAIETGGALADSAWDIFSSTICPLSPAAIADGGFEPYSLDANFGVASGTSASAPFVSATAALLLCLYPNLTNVQVAKQIIDNTDSLNNNAGWDKKSGYGRLNVYKALSNPVGSGQAVTYTKTFNSPNPFYTDRQTSTNITLAITQPEAVQLTIYDTSGEVVLSKSYAASELNDNPSNPQFKSYYVGWDGRNGAGQKVKTGIYFYTVNVGGRIGRNKIAVIQGSN
jgi:subtilisin family serine protease